MNDRLFFFGFFRRFSVNGLGQGGAAAADASGIRFTLAAGVCKTTPYTAAGCWLRLRRPGIFAVEPPATVFRIFSCFFGPARAQTLGRKTTKKRRKTASSQKLQNVLPAVGCFAGPTQAKTTAAIPTTATPSRIRGQRPPRSVRTNAGIRRKNGFQLELVGRMILLMAASSSPPGWFDRLTSASLSRISATAVVLVVVGFLSYANSFTVPMLLDDDYAIAKNQSIHEFADLRSVWWPSPTSTTGGRPLLNLSFALNYAISGLSVRSYHVVNLAIHLAAGSFLFGLVRRTLHRTGVNLISGHHATALAAVVSAVWLLHPLQTAAVTYISQRAESLMGFCYLATLYCFARSLSAPSPKRWQIASVVSCLAGMATKEVMVTAPILVLLYDRAFVTGSFSSALARRRLYYCALASSWLLLAVLMIASRISLRNIGFDQGIGAWDYLCAQAKVVAGYLSLAAWPHPLVFDYGAEYGSHSAREIWFPAAVVLTALAATAVLWRKSPALGFPAVAFFLLLAPTSSFVPVAQQPMAENRMYLPLAALVIGVVGLAARFLWRPPAVAGIAALLAAGLGVLTSARNAVLADPVALWQETLRVVPGNSRAHANAAVALGLAGRSEEAELHFREALRLNPRSAPAHANYAYFLSRRRRNAEAIEHSREALRLFPNYASAHQNLASVLAHDPPRLPEALFHYREVVRHEPLNLDAHAGIVGILAKLGRFDEARAHATKLLARHPGASALRRSLADACVLAGRTEEAVARYRELIAAGSTDAEVFYNLAVVLHTLGRPDDALPNYERALQLDPQHAGALNNLGMLRARAGRLDEAIRCFEAALAIKPDFQAARDNLALYRARQARGGK